MAIVAKIASDEGRIHDRRGACMNITSGSFARIGLFFSGAILAIWSGHASASCWFTVNTTVDHVIDVPGQVYMPRDSRANITFYTSPQQPLPQVSWRCDGNEVQGVVNNQGAQSSSSVSVLPIGTTGLAWQWIYNATTVLGGYGYASSNGGWGFGGTTHGFRLLKIGLVTPGTVVPAGPIGEFRFGNLAAVRMHLDEPITIVALACETPDVEVPMGTHHKALFTGPRAKVGTRDFVINVNTCPVGLNAIYYSLRSLHGMADAGNGVINLSATSTATGVGIQLTDRSDNAVIFGSKHPTTGYNRSSGGDFAIPLRAAYYQTASTVSGGSAEAYVELTMSYE